MIKLPIDSHLSEIAKALNESEAVVIEAPPGTGKTTRVPAHLAFDLGLRVIVLEPRRIAASQSALRVASERGLTHGIEVGHAFRNEAKWGERTQLLFATEGTFLSLYSKNAFDYDVVVIDEFHERHLDGDFALALLSAQSKKIIVMSATLDGLDLEGHFRRLDKSVIRVEVKAPLFECELRYLENIPSVLSVALERKVMNALEEALDFGGDILVFLPGVREIESTKRLIEQSDMEVCVTPLHGRLEIKEQARAFEPSKLTKVILATNVAESSLTVPGVRVVIDSGISKEVQWSSWSRVSQLKEIKIAKSNAIQRMGRAIREGNGLCLRLYAKLDFDSRALSVKPEIERTGLEAIRLRHLEMGSPICEWFEAPNDKSWQEALEGLRAIGAYSEIDQQLTPIGQKMAGLPLEPEWARALLELENFGKVTRRDFARYLARRGVQRESEIAQLMNRNLSKEAEAQVDLGRVLIAGFIRSLGRVRSHDIVSASGIILKLSHQVSSVVHEGDWGLILEVDGRGRVQDFCVIESDWIYELDPLPIEEKLDIKLDEKRGLCLIDQLSVGALSLEDNLTPVTMDQVPQELKAKASQLLAKMNEQALTQLKQGEKWERLKFLYQFKDGHLNSLEEDLALFCSSGLDYSSESFTSFLEMRANERWAIVIERELPLEIGKLPVSYDEVSGPFIMAHIQYFYGLTQTPRLPLSGEPLLLKLQGPHKRPLQLTRDLAGFWQRGYQEILKEMRREYPRHHWPDEPQAAPPILLKRQL